MVDLQPSIIRDHMIVYPDNSSEKQNFCERKFQQHQNPVVQINHFFVVMPFVYLHPKIVQLLLSDNPNGTIFIESQGRYHETKGIIHNCTTECV
jgi:hypothetical protein